ncbi:hypothetical protein [Nocardia sp. NPDC059239]|uniref:hypothetical protein n=1 Tax=unclassified Nocardia TaxID=2637762 RepID=UPI0036A4EF16
MGRQTNDGRHEGAVEQITLAVAELDKAQRRVNDTVRAARADGASWEVIGRAAGISRQSAHERWAKIMD